MYLKLGERTAAKCADEVIVLEPRAQYFKDTYGRETRFIPNGIAPVESVSPDVIADMWSLRRIPTFCSWDASYRKRACITSSKRSSLITH